MRYHRSNLEEVEALTVTLIGGKPAYVPGQVIVKFERNFSERHVVGLAQRLGMSAIQHFDVPETMAERFDGELYQMALRPGETAEAAVRNLSGQPGVAYAEPNYVLALDAPAVTPTQAAPTNTHGDGLPDDLDPRLWGLHNQGQDGGAAGVDIGAAGAWQVATGRPNGSGPLVCVVDTGLDYDHEDLKANVWTNPGEVAGDGLDNDGNGVVDDVHGANFAYGTSDPRDDNSHGSHCAGIIGAVGNNGKGIVGVNWNATIAGAKVFDSHGMATNDALINGILYSARIGARVTSNSWGGGLFSQALHDAFQASPALHICAAGNFSSDNDVAPFYPADYDLDNIVSVAAIDRKGALAPFSNYGANSVDVAAPGVDILSTVPGGYATMSGTSMAAPHVAGVAALVLARFPNLSNDELKARLVNTSVHQDNLEGRVRSAGRVNATAAIREDSIPPAAPGDLSVAEAGASSMTLRFTATGDDGAAGRACSYEVRYARTPIVDRASWDRATVVQGLPRPQPSGTVESLRVPIPPEEEARPYFFALRVLDQVGNASPLTTASGTSVAAAVPFRDDFETDSSDWTTTGGWARVDAAGRGKVYTDSPGGAYPENCDAALTSRRISLAEVSGPRLFFSERHDTEARCDFLRVEVSEDGATWTELARYDGYGAWTDRALDLGPWEGKTIQIRFRLTSDGSMNKDGAYVDDVRISGERR